MCDVIGLLKVRQGIVFVDCIGLNMSAAHVAVSVLMYTSLCETDGMQCLQVTHLMRFSGTVQLAAAACSMDVLRVWGRYALCFILLLCA